MQLFSVALVSLLRLVLVIIVASPGRGRCKSWRTCACVVDSKPSFPSPKDDEVIDQGVPYETLRPTYTHEAISKLMQMGVLKYVIR